MKDMTLINVIFDRSGSMNSIADEAVGMFNRFLDEQKELPDYAELSLVQFDDLYEENYTRCPIKECESLVLGKTYQPRGMTALFDAVGKTIGKINEDLKALSDEEKPKRVLFMILTDGYENASKEYTGESVKKLIDKQKKDAKWDFIFLAAGIDAFTEGAKFGMDLGKCANFDNSAVGMRSVGATMSAYATSYRTTGDNTMDVKDHQD